MEVRTLMTRSQDETPTTFNASGQGMREVWDREFMRLMSYSKEELVIFLLGKRP